MKLSTRRDALFAQLQTVTRAASTRSAVQALSGVQVQAQGGAHRAAGHRHGDRPARSARGRGRPRGRRRAAGAAARRRRPRAAGRRAHARAARRRAGRRAQLRLRDLPHPHAAPRGLPAAAGAGRRRPARRPGPALVETVVKVARAASRDETRPVLTGILVSAGEQELRMVATDSYRLAVKETQLEAPLARSFEANVPARALQELTRIVQHGGRRARSRCRCARTRSCSRPPASCSPRG